MAFKNTPIFAVIKREGHRISKNRAYQFLLLVGPLIGILMLYSIFKQGVVHELPIAMVDHDNTILSHKIAINVDGSPDVRILENPVDLFEAKSLLERGIVEAVVYIPQDTEEHVYAGKEAKIPIYINGTNVLKAGLIQRSVLTTIRTVSGGIAYKKQLAAGKSDEDAMTRVVPIKLHKHVLFNPYTNYSYFLSSAMMNVMLFLFVFLSAIYTLGNELKRGTGKELLSVSNNSVRLAIVGKLVPYTIIFSGFAMFINLLLFHFEKMPMNGNMVLLIAGQFITVITYQLLGLIFIGVTQNLRLAMSLGSAYSIMSITFSGLTFPLEAMPKLIQYITSVFPFTWWEKLFISQALRGAPIAEALPYICYILLFQVLALCFLMPYKRHLLDPSCWGKS